MAKAVEDFFSSSDDSMDQPSRNVVPSFSFSGCGFLGVYHIGVASCLRDHTDVVNRKEIRFAGASAGALVATTLLCDIDFGEMTRLFLQIAQAVRDKEQVDLALMLRDVMNHYLPEDAHIRLRNRLYISMTILQGLECGLVTDFHSKEHLIDCLIASSYVPGFIGWIPPGIDGDCFVDVHNRSLAGFASKHRSETSSPSSSTSSSAPSSLSSSSSRRRISSLSHSKCLHSLPSRDSSGSLSTLSEEDESLEYSSEESEGLVHEEFISGDESSQSLKEDEEKFCKATSKLLANKVSKDQRKGYLNRLVWLCFRGLQKTSSVMRHIPVASRMMQSMSPRFLGEFEGFIEALLLEMMSNRYTVLDGGFSDNIPVFDSNTITVCPFSGESDICPRDMTAIDLSIELAHTSFHVSDDNIFRLNHALSPMEPQMLLSLCEEGYNECLRFLHRKDLLSCRQHLMTRAAISTSACNIGHSHCRCHQCVQADRKIRKSLSCANCQQVKHRALNSILPEDVRNEFYTAIEKFKTAKQEPVTNTFWGQLIELFWWCAEKMYAGTMAMADLSMEFHAWLLHFYDNLACFAKFAILPMGQKRRLIRYMLSTLRTSISATTRRSMAAVHASLCR